MRTAASQGKTNSECLKAWVPCTSDVVSRRCHMAATMTTGCPTAAAACMRHLIGYFKSASEIGHMFVCRNIAGVIVPASVFADAIVEPARAASHRGSVCFVEGHVVARISKRPSIVICCFWHVRRRGADAVAHEAQLHQRACVVRQVDPGR